MVISRTKLLIHDDLLKPRPRMTISFTGTHPERFYHEIPKLLATVFRVGEEAIQEKKYYWSKGEPEKFKISWEVNKDLDKFSFYWIVIDFEGTVSKGSGSASIVIEGALRTEYPQDTVWEKSILHEFLRLLWHKTVYFSKRDEYLKEGRRLLGIFIEDLKGLTRV